MALRLGDRWTWIAFAFILGLVVGGVSLLPPPEPPQAAEPGPPALARVRNAGTEAVQVTFEVKDREGRVLHRVHTLVGARGELDIPMDLAAGTYLFAATFRTDVLPPATAEGSLEVEVGRCGEGRATGALFRVTGSRSAVRLDGVDEACF